MNANKKTLLAKSALFGATVIWGSSFFIMKNTVDEIPVFYLLSMRFLTGAVVVLLMCAKNLRKINFDYLFKGSVIGALLFAGYVLQTFGVMDTTPGKNAFLTTVYCIIVPFVYWAFARIRPDRYNILASVVCMLGIGLVSLSETFTICAGDLFTLAGGLFFALHIVFVAIFARDRDILLLTMIQFASAAVLGAILGACFETFPAHIGTESIFSLIYLCLFATSAALLMQNVGQKYTPPSTAALILSLESVFGVLFSIIFYGERLTVKITAGFILIFAAVIISETKLSFLKKVK
jgi:drug/metabolite transporter (DMT)-like permease